MEATPPFRGKNQNRENQIRFLLWDTYKVAEATGKRRGSGVYGELDRGQNWPFRGSRLSRW